MPIRINLLAEAQLAEEERRHDPVKRAIWIGAFVVAVTLIGSLTLQFKVMAVKSDVNSLEAGWKTIEAKVKEVELQRVNLHEVEAKLSAIDQFTTNRMLWASVLDALQNTSVENVQLAHLKTEQTYVLNEGTKARTNGTTVIAGKPTTVTEKIVLSLDAKDYSARQADQVPKFKEALVGAKYFAESLQKTNKVQLTSLTPPQLDGSRAFVSFGLQLFFPDKERRLYE